LKYFIILILITLQIYSNNNRVCKNCHSIIYKEFQDSMHKNSTLKSDTIHNAIWKLHPNNKKGNYTCAKCHTPINKDEGVGCLSCHKIIDIKEDSKYNENIYEKNSKTLYSAQKGEEDKKIVYHQESSWFGLSKKSVGSPYHNIDYRNKIFYNGKVCMGCHSHKQNAKGFNVCKTSMSGSKDSKKNCITCHMPQVPGSATTIRLSKTHAYHGFAGIYNEPKKLSKYIDLNITKTKNGFSVTIENKTPHNLLIHTLRVLELQVLLIRANKTEILKSYKFVKIIGTNNKPSMPWLATQVIKDTSLKANEKREFNFNTILQKGDEVVAKLGFYKINPKIAKKLKIKEKKLTDFTILKRAVLISTQNIH